MNVRIGTCGNAFLVFRNEEDASEYADFLESEFGIVLPFACFGGYMNALELPY